MSETGNSNVLKPTSPLTEAQAQKNFEQTQAESIKNLSAATNITVERDDKGNEHRYWMGIEVSEEMLPFLQYAASAAPQYIDSFLKKGVYDNSKKIAENLIKDFEITASKEAGHKTGLAVAAAVSGLLIGLQPITEVGQSISLRNKERNKIYKSLDDVISTNSDYKHNEVIQTALERSNKIFTDGCRRAFAELPAVVVNAIYAHGSWKELAAEKNTEFKVKQELAENKTGSFSKEVEDLIRHTKDLEKEKTAFFRKQANVDIRDEKAVKAAENDPKYKIADESWAKIKAKRELEQTEKLKAEAAGKNGEKPKEADGSNKLMLINMGAGLTQAFKSKLKKESSEASKEKSAYEQIIALQKKFENGDIREGSSITKQIVEIFQANEKDRGRAHIGAALIAKFEPLAKRIGKVISDGELSPLALVNLVGNGEVMNHRRFVSEEDLEQVINKQRSIFAGHDKTSFEDFLADFTKPEAIVAALKDNFKELKGGELAMVAALLPDDVLRSMDIKADEAKSLQRAGHGLMYEFVKKEIVRIGQQSEEELDKAGLSKEQISALKEASEKIEKGDKKDIRKIIEGTAGDKNNIVVSAVRKVDFEDQISGQEKPVGFWTARIKMQPAVKPADIIKEREDEQDIPKAEVIAAQAASHNHAGQHQHH